VIVSVKKQAMSRRYWCICCAVPLTAGHLVHAMCGLGRAPEANHVTTLCCRDAGQLKAVVLHIPCDFKHPWGLCIPYGHNSRCAEVNTPYMHMLYSMVSTCYALSHAAAFNLLQHAHAMTVLACSQKTLNCAIHIRNRT
jgi:hypothetical protein